MTIEADEKPTFTQEDLAEIEADDDGGDGKEGDAPSGEGGDKAQDAKPTDDKSGEGKSGKTLADGADTEVEAKAKEEADAKKRQQRF